MNMFTRSPKLKRLLVSSPTLTVEFASKLIEFLVANCKQLAFIELHVVGENAAQLQAKYTQQFPHVIFLVQVMSELGGAAEDAQMVDSDSDF